MAVLMGGAFLNPSLDNANTLIKIDCMAAPPNSLIDTALCRFKLVGTQIKSRVATYRWASGR